MTFSLKTSSFSFEDRAIVLVCVLSLSACGASQDAGEPGDQNTQEAPNGVGGAPSTGGINTGGSGAASGGATAVGASVGTGGGPSGTGGEGGSALCDDAALVWKSARKTNYTSYPDPASVECVEYNGCKWAGWFAGCTDQQSEEWVEANNIAALFPGFNDYSGHQICIRSGEQTMVVNVIDTCADSDCDGCCTQNQANNDALVDLESFTNQRWALPDGIIEWASLGPNPTPICD